MMNPKQKRIFDIVCFFIWLIAVYFLYNFVTSNFDFIYQNKEYLPYALILVIIIAFISIFFYIKIERKYWKQINSKK